MRQCPTIESENYPSIHHEDTQAAPEEICEKKEGDLAMLRERHLPHKSKGPALCAIIGCLKRHRTGGEARSHYGKFLNNIFASSIDTQLGKDHDDFQCYYKKHGFSENCGKTFVNSMGLRRHYADHISDVSLEILDLYNAH